MWHLAFGTRAVPLVREVGRGAYRRVGVYTPTHSHTSHRHDQHQRDGRLLVSRGATLYCCASSRLSSNAQPLVRRFGALPGVTVGRPSQSSTIAEFAIDSMRRSVGSWAIVQRRASTVPSSL